MFRLALAVLLLLPALASAQSYQFEPTPTPAPIHLAWGAVQMAGSGTLVTPTPTATPPPMVALMFTGCDDDLNEDGAGTYYLPVQSAWASDLGSNRTGLSQAQGYMAVKGAFSDLKVVLQGAVLGGDATFDLQLLVNYSPGYTGFEACTDNVLSCQILDDEDTCTVDTDTCEVDVGDLIVWELVLAGTLGGTDQYANWQIKFTADSGSRYPLIMTTLNQVQTEPRYLTIAGNSLIDSEPEEVSTRAPVDGSITDFKCVLDQASGSGSRTFTVYRDDVSTALSCLITNPDTFCDIDTDVVPYDKDSIYYIVHTETVGPSQDNYVTCGLELYTDNGDFPILGGHWGNTSLDSDRWMGSQNTQHTQGTIDTAIYHNTTAWTPTDLYFSVENPPGTSNGYDLRVQEDLVDNIRVDLGPTDTENVTTGGTDQMAAGSEMTIWFDPTNTPDNPDQVLWSIGGTVP